jgi:aminopeptidase N
VGLGNCDRYSPAVAGKHPLREVLPDTVVPIHYDLALSPDADALIFQGKVAITVEVRRATPAVALDAVGLTLRHATVDDGKQALVTSHETLGRITLNFGTALPPGRHVLSRDYAGKIGRSTLGFFAMDYASADGPRRTLATNFEPTAARQLLPCWDEPGRKATFSVSVDAPKDRVAISNMPVAEMTSLSPTVQRVRFASPNNFAAASSSAWHDALRTPMLAVLIGRFTNTGNWVTRRRSTAAFAITKAGCGMPTSCNVRLADILS